MRSNDLVTAGLGMSAPTPARFVFGDVAPVPPTLVTGDD